MSVLWHNVAGHEVGRHMTTLCTVTWCGQPPPGEEEPADGRWAAQEHERRVTDLGPDLACEFESVALQAMSGIPFAPAGALAARAVPLMSDAYKIGLGHRNPVTVKRLESITRAWHRDTCGCTIPDCAKRAGIARFVEG